jgi:hypothetical protein
MSSRGGRKGATAGLGGPSEMLEMSGPTGWIEPPLEFPLEWKTCFGRNNPLRPYNTTKFSWPTCAHGYECVVQMNHTGPDSGRRFFRCPMGFVSTKYSY